MYWANLCARCVLGLGLTCCGEKRRLKMVMDASLSYVFPKWEL